ncbi:MAG: hypothetical protein IKL89_03855 [Clostridia bacterium]|nr:hypothetical protein [Clostridia bacterium]
MIESKLSDRALPPLPAAQDPAAWERERTSMLDILQREEYGRMPAAPAGVTAELLERDDSFLANRAVCETITLSFVAEGREYSFPIRVITPKLRRKVPYFVTLSFREELFDRYLPLEEICMRGYGVAVVHYKSVAGDDDDFAAGLGPLAGDRTRPDAPGKIALWAYAASRTADYLLTRPECDAKNLAVIGHSRLGKTALLCGACDERFRFVISNDSGCSGAAITRGKVGESLGRITEVFPYWFCPGYRKYAEKETSLPFDQHWLLALIAPRHLLVGSAAEDLWADPASEYLACCAASPAWRIYGKSGLKHFDRLPVPGEACHAGTVGYHLRPGAHFMARTDWVRYMDYIQANRAK